MIGRNTDWWTAVSVLFLIAIGAFTHTYIRESRRSFYSGIRESLATRVICCSMLLAYSVTAAIISANDIGPTWLYIVLPCAATVGAIVIAIIGEHSQNQLYAASGIPRWRPRSSHGHQGV
jgi:predicted membrane protein